jgi:hypothetical protein
MVSYFPNVSGNKVRDIPIVEAFDIIRSGEIKAQIEAIRNEESVANRDKMKRNIPAITVSGLFKERHSLGDFLKHNGLIQVDFDKVTNPQDVRQNLIQDKYTFSCFISPSGTGVKVIVKIIPEKELHERSFLGLSKYYSDRYGLEMDKKCKDISRLCFLSYDPDIFVNEQSYIYKCESDVKNNQISASSNRLTDITIDVESIVSRIETARIDITENYDNWLKLGFALADGLGINGLPFYQRLSQFYPGYNPSECEKQFYHCLNGKRNGLTIKTFFQIAKEHGISIQTGRNVQENKATNDQEVRKKIDHGETRKEVFYSPVYGKDNEGNPIVTDIKINYRKFIDLLYSFGFRRFDLDKQFIFVKIEKQIVCEVTTIQIQDYFISWIKSLPSQLEFNINRNSIIEKIYKSPSTYFCESKLSLLKSETDIIFNSDTKAEGYIYYQNGYILCTNENYKLYDYSNLKKHVWRNQILPRKFTYQEQQERNIHDMGVFARFVFNIANKDVIRFNALCSILGYNLHSYFDYKLRATILTDSKISDKPDGRTGKTLLCKSLGKIKNYCEINGKDFDPSNKHKYELANLDTQIICLNDVRKNFDFESLYNDITEHLSVNRKNQQPFNIKAKMLVTTNKTVATEGDSSKDRSIEFELSEHYSAMFSPYDDFGHWFFSDWDEKEWGEFDNFMMYCICLYLKAGIIATPPINLNRRKIIDNTCPEFVEFMDEKLKQGVIEFNKEYDKKTIYTMFIEEYPDIVEHRYFGKQSTFSKFLKVYCKFSDEVELLERKSMANRFFMLKRKDCQ